MFFFQSVFTKVNRKHMHRFCKIELIIIGTRNIDSSIILFQDFCHEMSNSARILHRQNNCPDQFDIQFHNSDLENSRHMSLADEYPMSL